MGEWILTSSVLIVLVMILRRTLKGRLRLWLRYALWLPVLLRLLIPFSLFDSAFSVMNAVDRAKENAAETSLGKMVYEVGESPVPVMGYDRAYEEVIDDYEAQGIDIAGLSSGQREELEYEAYAKMMGPSVGEILKSALVYIWVAGMAVVGGCLLVSNLRFAAKLRQNRRRIASEECGSLSVYISELVETPCLFGVIRPAAYLPEEVLEDKVALRYVLAHEHTHYLHGDPLWSLLRCVCLVLHWYNPLVWKAAYLSRQDGELACDEAVISRIGEASRTDYGRVIIALSCGKSGPGSLFTAATTMVGSEGDIKERIVLIAKKPRMAVWAGFVVLVAVIIAVGCTFTGGKAKNKSDNKALLAEDKRFSCAKFEYAGEPGDGFKIVTGEIGQFDSLNQMNLVPSEEVTLDEWIYRVTFDWSEIAPDSEEYVVEVGEDCLTVNGSVYVADGFDFSEVVDYFAGKYKYFDYEIQYSQEELQRQYHTGTVTINREDFYELYQNNPSQPEYVNALYRSYVLGEGALISLYLENGELYQAYPIWELSRLENIAHGMTHVEWKEGTAPEVTNGKRVVISTANGQHSMTFYLEEEDIVSYWDGQTTTYWQTNATDSTYLLFSDSINAYVRRVYDYVEASVRKVRFSGTGSAEEVAEQFAENILRDYYLGRVPGGWVTVTDYEVMEWSLVDVSDDERAILGWIKYGVKPENPTPRTASFWAGGWSDGEGVYEEWQLLFEQFLLEQQEDGKWDWNTGYYGKELDEDLLD